MKYLLLLVCVALLQSCAICKPPRNNAEMEQRVLKHDRKPFRARLYMKQRSDGYYLVYVTRGFAPTKAYLFECKPDSAQVEALRNGYSLL